MKLSPYDHAVYVCKWHDTQPQAPHVGADREWARRWLAGQVAGGVLTNDEANGIRRGLGWEIEAAQLELFEVTP